MSALALPSLIRSPFRRALNWAWLAVALALVGVCAAFLITRQRAVNRHNANINRIKSAVWSRGAEAGQVWYELDGDRVKYAVFSGPVAAPAAGDPVNVPNVDLGRPYSAGWVWFNRSRTERIRVDSAPPRFFFCLQGLITSEPLPAGFSERELVDFIKTVDSFEGVPGFQRWQTKRQR